MTLERLVAIVAELITFDDPLYILNKDEDFKYLFSVELDRDRREISFNLWRTRDYTVVDEFGNISANSLYYTERLWEYGIYLESEDWRLDPDSASAVIDRVEYFIDNLSTIKDMIKELKAEVENE